jgi:hypothetical protein
MFRAMKSSGFNMDATHLTNLDRLSTLLSVIAIAFVWACLAGIDQHENVTPIKDKNMAKEHIAISKMD